MGIDVECIRIFREACISMDNSDIQRIRQDLENALSRSFDNRRGIAIYGAGNASVLAHACFEFIEAVFASSGGIKYFIDDTPSKYGTSFYGKSVINFEDAHKMCKSSLILINGFLQPTRLTMLESLKADPIDDVDIATLDELVLCLNRDKVLEAFDILSDDVSKEIYANMILVRMLKAKQKAELVNIDGMYLQVPYFNKWSISDVFVDCGAYIGDTVEMILNLSKGKVAKIFAFEPDSDNFS